MTAPPLPLDGLRVVELGSAIAGPFCCRILADLGAEVIKVEAPAGGDPTRTWGKRPEEVSGLVFQTLNKEKRSVLVDFAIAEEVDRLRRFIVAGADVVVQNLRPGIAARIGLDAARLRAEAPALIHCNVSAYGAEGPLKAYPGYEALLQAFSGIMDGTGQPDGPPARVGFSVNDLGTAMWAAIGVLAAVVRRQRTGDGATVDAALLDTGLAWQMLGVAMFLTTGEAPKRTGMRGPLVAPNAVYGAADGLLLVTIGTDAQFRKFCDTVGRPDMAEHPELATNAARIANPETLDAFLNQVLAQKPREVWWAELSEAGIACAPVQSLPEALDHEQTAAGGILQTAPDGSVSVIGSPLKFDGRRPPFRHKAPELGASRLEDFDTPDQQTEE